MTVRELMLKWKEEQKLDDELTDEKLHASSGYYAKTGVRAGPTPPPTCPESFALGSGRYHKTCVSSGEC